MNALLCLFCIVSVVLSAPTPCTAPYPLAPYTFVQTLGAGASGTALLVEKSDHSRVVLKSMKCDGAGAVGGWTNEEANYGSINLITDAISPLWTKQAGVGWKCNGLETTGGAEWVSAQQLGDKGARVAAFCDAAGEEPVDCCWSVLQTATGKFPFGKDGPMAAAVRANALKGQVWMYQLIYALYSGWNTIAFQHWDLKEPNVMVGAWPGGKTKMCFYHTAEAGGGKCITNADTQADAKLLRMIDFDLSATGGIGNIARVKFAGATKTDGKSLKDIFANVRPEGALSDAETAFNLLLDAIIAATPAATKATISSDEYTALSTAYQNALKAAYFADLADAPAKAECTDTCAIAESIAAYPALLEGRSSVHRSRLRQKVLGAK